MDLFGASEASIDGDAYVPEFRGNRDLDPDVQGYVVLKPISGRDMQRIELSLKIKVDKLGMNWFQRQQLALKDQILRKHIVGVVHIFRSPGSPILTGDELVDFCLEGDKARPDAGLLALLNEIYEAITDRAKLEEGLRKN